MKQAVISLPCYLHPASYLLESQFDPEDRGSKFFRKFGKQLGQQGAQKPVDNNKTQINTHTN
jgi:hypothetical protein